MRSVGQKNVSAILALFLAAALTGCGGGSSPTGTTGNGNNTTNVSGVVADGYLTGARVFLDKNGNKKYDAGEPTNITIAGGNYTLKDVSAADIAAYPIVVEVTTSTVDEERGPITTPYILSAPAGNTFISPLTTLVQNQMEASGISAAEAEQTVKIQLGLITMSPLADYKPGVSTASDEAKLAANVAKVIATTIANNKMAIEDAVKASGGTTTVQSVVSMIMQQIMQNLPALVQQVKSNATTSGTLSEDNVTSISGTVAISTSDSAALQQQLAASGSTAALSDLPAALTAGMYWVEQWGDGSAGAGTYSAGYEKFFFTASTGALTFNQYRYANNAWQARTNGGSDNLFLTESGWQADPESGVGTFDPATGLYSSAKGFQKMVLRGVKKDVSGQRVSAYLMNSFALLSVVGTQTFPAGSEAYQLTMIPLVDIYKLKTDNRYPFSTLNSMLAGASSSNGSYINSDNFTLSFGVLKSDNTGVLELKSGSNTYSSIYKKVTVHNVEMVIADITSVTSNSTDKFLIFTVYNGAVCGGYLSPKNVAGLDSSYNFNKTAISAIMSASGLPAVVQ